MSVRAVLVLAAGASSRYGENKLLVPIDGVPLVRVVVRAALRSSAREVIVVTGYQADRIRQALKAAPVRLVANRDYPKGMGGSVASGAAALAPDCEHVAVVLGDQPVEPEVIDELFALAIRSGLPIAAAVYRGARRHPVVFAASLFDELRQVRGHAGVRVLLEADPSRVALLALDRPVPPDLDVAEDYDELARSLRERGLAGTPSGNQ